MNQALYAHMNNKRKMKKNCKTQKKKKKFLAKCLTRGRHSRKGGSNSQDAHYVDDFTLSVSSIPPETSRGLCISIASSSIISLGLDINTLNVFYPVLFIHL
jgi:hypothetical protein